MAYDSEGSVRAPVFLTVLILGQRELLVPTAINDNAKRLPQMVNIDGNKKSETKPNKTVNSSSSVIVRVRVVLKMTVVGDRRFDNVSWSHFDSEDDFRSGCLNVSHPDDKGNCAGNHRQKG